MENISLTQRFCLHRLTYVLAQRRLAADPAARALLDQSIFSIYLDCRNEGVLHEANNVVAYHRRGSLRPERVLTHA